jgi:hypothetical protein
MDPLQEPLAGGGGLQRCAADVDPPPRPWPGLQKLAIVTIAAIVVLGCLQFLPPTHFRNPNDPQRNWIPIDGSRNPTVRYCAPRFVSLSVRVLGLGIAEAMCSVD